MQVGQKYRHYKKGTIYQIIALAKHTEDLTDMVVYQDVEDLDKVWVRPRQMFEEILEKDGKKQYRFELVEA